MNRSTLLQHLRKHGCTLKREGASHSFQPRRLTIALAAE